MSKRCPSKAVGKISTAVMIFMLLISFSFISSGAHAAVQSDIKVSIPEGDFAFFGTNISVPVIMENNTDIQIGGFEFMIKYDTTVLEFLDINLDPINSCNWDLLGHHTELSGVEKIYAVPGTGPLGCDFTNGVDTLCFLEFYVIVDFDNECQGFPIRFYWTQCTDNTLINTTDDSLLMSYQVFDLYTEQFIQQDDVLPTIHGAPDSCYNLAGAAGKYRLVDFYNGEVKIPCQYVPDNTGDVNLNGLQYEIADYVMFQSYYLNGVEVFVVNPQGQLQATDCNKDGVYPTLRDLVFMYRVIIGDINPLPKMGDDGNKLFPPTALFVQDTLAQEVNLVFPDSLNAIHLIFDGEIVPTYNGPGDFAYAFDGSVTRLLIAPWFGGNDDAVYQGMLFTYTGSGILDSSDVADWEMRNIGSAVQVIGGEPMCGDINADGMIQLDDAVYLLYYIFYSMEPPVSMTAADVTCDGKINISDAVLIVRYLFTGSPVPCGNCP